MYVKTLFVCVCVCVCVIFTIENNMCMLERESHSGMSYSFQPRGPNSIQSVEFSRPEYYGGSCHTHQGHRAGLGPWARRGGQQQAEGWATSRDTRVRALLHLGAGLEPWPARQGKLQRTMLLLKAGGEL